ncbi:MAG: Nramp family divalent metal transporter [Chloroflexi bacterium]|nr:Nramp family divalent metal transporter [Chloroflexota bacterium]
MMFRRLHAPSHGLMGLLAILGPGLIAATAGDDAGGIATYASVGAKYGYDLLWMMIPITISLAVVQEMAMRLGAATGRGLLDLVRERFGIGWALLAVGVVLLANGGVIITEFVGVGAALELFGVSRYLAVPLAAVLVWWLVVKGNYHQVEMVFLAMTIVFFAYPVAAILASPDWSEVAVKTVVPTIKADPAYLMLFVATVGTTITPYMQLFAQSSTVERGVARRSYGPERIDAWTGAVFGNLVSYFIIVATAATLHAAGQTEIASAAQAAQALVPVAGRNAGLLFAIGLLGASLLAAGVLPVATAYSVAEAFGFRKGVNLDYRRAPIFVSLFTGLVAVGALVALIPGLPVIGLLVAIQVLNAMLLPVILFFILRLSDNRGLMGHLVNGRVLHVVAWMTAIVVSFLTLLMLVNLVLQAFDLDVFSLLGLGGA